MGGGGWVAIRLVTGCSGGVQPGKAQAADCSSPKRHRQLAPLAASAGGAEGSGVHAAAVKGATGFTCGAGTGLKGCCRQEECH